MNILIVIIQQLMSITITIIFTIDLIHPAAKCKRFVQSRCATKQQISLIFSLPFVAQ